MQHDKNDVHRGTEGLRGLLPTERLRDSASRLLIAQALATAIAFVTEFVLARALGPEGRGAFGLLTAALQMGALVGSFALAFVATRDIRQGILSARDAIDAVYVGTITASIVVSAVVVGCLQAAYSDLFPFVSLAPLMLIIPFAAIANNSRYLLTGVSLSGRSAALLVLEKASLLVALVILLVLLGADNWQSALLGLTAATMATGVSAMLLLRHATLVGQHSPIRKLKATLVYLMGRAARIVPGNVSQFINYRLDIFLVAAWAGARQAGLYASAATLSSVLLYISNAASQAVYPVLCEEIAEGVRPNRTLRATWLMTRGVAALAVVGAISAPVTVPLILGAQYDGSVMPFVILLAAAVPLTIQQMVGGVLMATGRETATSVVAACAAVLTIGGCIVLVPPLGATGAALASLGAYTASAFAIFVLVAPALHVNLPGFRRLHG